MNVRSYSSPEAFKQALEQRLKAASKDGVDFARRRQLLVFDRFLARATAILAFEQTFMHRATHPLPQSLPDPPTSWATPYQQMARQNELAWPTLEQLTAVVAAFLNPVLARGSGVWHPARWNWD
jgi:hypothetical protein